MSMMVRQTGAFNVVTSPALQDRDIERLAGEFRISPSECDALRRVPKTTEVVSQHGRVRIDLAIPWPARSGWISYDLHILFDANTCVFVGETPNDIWQDAIKEGLRISSNETTFELVAAVALELAKKMVSVYKSVAPTPEAQAETQRLAQAFAGVVPACASIGIHVRPINRETLDLARHLFRQVEISKPREHAPVRPMPVLRRVAFGYLAAVIAFFVVTLMVQSLT